MSFPPHHPTAPEQPFFSDHSSCDVDALFCGKAMAYLPASPKAIGVSDVLTAYRPEYQLVKEFEPPQNGISVTRVMLTSYPFTTDPMPYASINLVNLAIEQSLLVHFDFLVSNGTVSGPWESLLDYRRLVNAGHWLVPKLHTRVARPVPLRELVSLQSRFVQIRVGNRRCVAPFSVTCNWLFSASGLAIFDANSDFNPEGSP